MWRGNKPFHFREFVHPRPWVWQCPALEHGKLRKFCPKLYVSRYFVRFIGTSFYFWSFGGRNHKKYPWSVFLQEVAGPKHILWNELSSFYWQTVIITVYTWNIFGGSFKVIITFIADLTSGLCWLNKIITVCWLCPFTCDPKNKNVIKFCVKLP